MRRSETLPLRYRQTLQPNKVTQAVNVQQKADLVDRLRGIVAFLPPFQALGFKFGCWTPAAPIPGKPNVCHKGYFTLSDVADSFFDAVHEPGWVTAGFDWEEWSLTPEAERLRHDPQALASATAEDLARLITVCIRSDRFAQGALNSHFESGLLPRILQRAERVVTLTG